MRLADFYQVEGLVVARQEIERQRRAEDITIVIGGIVQGRVLTQHVESAVRLELRRKLAEIDERLLDLGVTVE